MLTKLRATRLKSLKVPLLSDNTIAGAGSQTLTWEPSGNFKTQMIAV